MKKVLVGLMVTMFALSSCSYDFEQRPLENNANYNYNSTMNTIITGNK